MDSFQKSSPYSQLYIHIPYCRSKCIYCDFFSGSVKNVDWKRYLSAITGELGERINELPTVPTTIYLGGGTPSLIPEDNFVEFIKDVIKITGTENSVKEFTIEVNPEDVTRDKCIVWKNMGVNRVSIGIQTFNERELKEIRRNHSVKISCHALDELNLHFENVSLDLMFGLPSQTLSSFTETVSTAVAFNPKHISAYSLMLEPHTPLTVLHSQGKITLPDEEEYIKMWQYLSDTLSENGYKRYEISNYSKPGYESEHNRGYWYGNPYLGLGPGAHSFDGKRIRRWNPARINDYISRFSHVKDTRTHFYEEEHLNDEELFEETILTRMRIKEGVDLGYIKSRFGDKMQKHLLSNAYPLEEKGLISISDHNISLTRKGIMTCDDIIVSLSM